MTAARPSAPGQLSQDLPAVTHYLTGHDDSTRKAIVQSSRPATWIPFLNDTIAFNVIYTTSEFPVSLNNDQDIKTHDELLASKKLGLVNPSGTVCRMVDFCPKSEPLIHRTQSLDYGVVIEGSVEMVLDSGETKLMQRGDVAVQRATMHGWRNPSETEWARMLFVLQSCQEVRVGGEALTEDLGIAKGVEGISSASSKGDEV